MGVVVRGPSRPLAPFVERLGYYDGECANGWEPMPPTGTDHLLVNLGSGEFRWRAGAGSAIERVHSGAVVVPGSEGRVRVDLGQWRSAVFVSFQPGGAYPFLSVAPAAAGRPLLDLREVWGREGERLRDRLAGAPGQGRSDDGGGDAAGACGTAGAARSGGGGRGGRSGPRRPGGAGGCQARGEPVHVAAAFTAQVGLPPMRFARIRRLRRLLAAVHGRPGAGWAGDADAVPHDALDAEVGGIGGELLREGDLVAPGPPGLVHDRGVGDCTAPQS